jgi:hypothetical protein
MTYICNICNKIFKNNKSLKYHIDHNVCNNKKFICNECNKCYKLKSSLKKHFKSKHNDKFNDIDWKKKSSFIGNITTDNDEIPKNKYDCPFCKKEFPTSFNLKRHIMKSCNAMKKEQSEPKTTNITNNINNGNIVNNNNNINISINSFGKENRLPEEDMLEAIKDPRKIPLKYIELKHIKDKKNRNIYMENDKCDNIMVFGGDSWSEKKGEDVCHLLKNEAIDDIYEYLRDNIISNSEAINNRLDYIEKSQSVLRDIKLFLCYNKVILSDSFEKHGKKPIKIQDSQ